MVDGRQMIVIVAILISVLVGAIILNDSDSNIQNGQITPQMLDSINSPVSLDCVTINDPDSTQFEFSSCAGGGGGDNINVDSVGVANANFVSGDIVFTLDTVPSPDEITASVANDVILVSNFADGDWGDITIASNIATIDLDSVALGADTANAYVADLIGGAGISVSGGGGETATITVTTVSSETDFLISGALTCGAATQGKLQVHTTPLQYCDNAGTPALQYAAYGSSTGVALTATQLASNGANCGAGNYPLGVDEFGAVETCTAAGSGGDNISVNGSAATDANFIDGDIDFTLDTGPTPDTIAATVACTDCIALGTETTNAYVADLTGGDGITVSGGGAENATITVTTNSSEANFLISGALTCGVATQGKVQVHTTPLQYCDNSGTPTLRYAAYGNTTGESISIADDVIVVGDFSDGDWGDGSIASNVFSIDANAIALGTDTVNNYVADVTGGTGISVSGGGGETATITVATASNETDFIISGALTCGAATQGRVQVHTTPLQYCDNSGTPTLRYAAYGNTIGESISIADDTIIVGDIANGDWGDFTITTNISTIDSDAVALGTDTTNAYVTDLIGGTGISVSGGGSETATITVITASSETDFLASGALTCGAGTRGRIQIHTTPIQYCDNAGTPTLRYAAYGNTTGESISIADDIIVVGDLADGDWGDISITTNVASVDVDSVALGTDTTNNYVADITGGVGISVSGGGSENATITVVTASNEADFLISGALTCGASTQGKIQVHTTALQYCDNTGTPVLRYAAYGLSTGEATGLVCTTCVDTTDIADSNVTEAKLDAVDSPADEECLTWETGDDFEWQTCGGGGGDSITVLTVAAIDPDFINGDIDWTLDTGASPDTIAATVACTDCIALGTETTNVYVADLTGGAGISVSGGGGENATITVTTISSETDFLASGALTCGAATQGKIQVHTTALQYCDNTATPVLRYAAYGNTTGESISIADDTVVVGDLADGDWGDVSVSSNVVSIDTNSISLGTDTTGNYVADLTGGAGISVSGGGSETATITVVTASGETDFLASGALTCTTAQQGRIQVHTTALQYCDNAGTPTLRYAAYADSSGNATGLVCTTCVDTTDIVDSAITEGKLDAVDSPADEECLTWETGDDFEWQTCGGGGGDSITVIGVAATDPDFINGDIDWTLDTGASPDTISAIVACTDCIALGTETTNAYVADITGGAGISVSGGGAETATITVTTASSEADFLTSGALTCGSSTQGKIQVHTTALQYCDNAGTPTLRYAAYGNSSGESISIADDTIVVGDLSDGDWGDISVATNVVSIDAEAVTEAKLDAVDAPADEECLTWETTDDDFEWQACSAGGGDSVFVNTVAATDADFTNGDIDFTLNTGADPDTITATVACTDCVALGTETTNAYVADITGGSGISVSGGGAETATITVTTASGETDFLASGALTCTTAQQGRIQVHTTALQYCDNAGTPTLRYAAYGNSTGEAISIADDTIVVGDFADNDWGDGSITSNVFSIDANAIALGTDTTNAYVADITGGAGISVSGGGGETATITVVTASGETDFLASGALTCTTAQQGRIQVHTTALQYCDNTGTPVLRYAAYATSTGNATGVECTTCVDVTDLDQSDSLVWTGNLDFGGATGLEVPNGTGATIDAAGEVTVDTTDDQLAYFGSTTRVLSHKKTISFLLESPTDADNFLIKKFSDAITLLTIDCITDPADSSESVAVIVQERNSTGDSPATMDAITCDSDGAVETSFTDGALAAAGWMSIDIGTVTGTVTQVVITVEYTTTRE